MNQNKQKILIVDDNVENIKIAANALSTESLIIGFAKSGEEAIRRTSETDYDLVLMDVMMPGMDGFEATKQIKQNPQYAHIPIIFLTAKNDDESIELAYECGGVDHISKPFRHRELMVRIKHHLEKKLLIKHLDFLASRDVMTGLYNRRMFFELSNPRFLNDDKKICIAMLDIDHFKKVNDTYGHQVGDLLIKKVASTIETLLPEDAVFGRIGGEEFAILFDFELIENAVNLVDSIRQAVESCQITLEDGLKLGCTISIGLAEKQKHMSKIDQLLNKADIALYKAKQSGRNRSVFRD